MRKGEKMIFNKGEGRQIKVQLITRNQGAQTFRTETPGPRRLTLIGFICLWRGAEEVE